MTEEPLGEDQLPTSPNASQRDLNPSAKEALARHLSAIRERNRPKQPGIQER